MSPPKFYALPRNKIVNEGDNVRFQCSVHGHPIPVTKWDRDNRLIENKERFRVYEEDDMRILEILNVRLEDAGLYRITLENDVGRVGSSARLDVVGE